VELSRDNQTPGVPLVFGDKFGDGRKTILQSDGTNWVQIAGDKGKIAHH